MRSSKFGLAFVLCSFSVVFSFAQISTSIAVYKNGANLITGTWDGSATSVGTLTEVSTNAPFEGGQHLFFQNYDLAGAWWSGFGLNLDSWGSTAALDFSSQTHLRIAYRGLTQGHLLEIRLSDGAILSAPITVGEATSDYKTVELPLAQFGVNLKTIREIDISVGGAATGTGSVFVDAIEFLNKSNSIYKNSRSLITGTWDGSATSVGTLAEVSSSQPFEGGQHLRFQNYDLAGGWWAGFGLNFTNWGTTAPLNFSGATHLRLAYRGMEQGQILEIKLADTTKLGMAVTVGEADLSYKTVDVSLAILGTGLDLKAINEININVGGAATGTGTVFIDAIELIDANQNPPQKTLAHRRAEKMGNGVNLSNWLEASWLLPSNYPIIGQYSRQDLANFAACGFKTVRLPIIFERLADPNPPHLLNTNQVAFSLIDSVIAWADQFNLRLIIDNHHGSPELSDLNYATEIPHITAIWRQLIARYGHLDPEKVFFELYNEPNGISNANLKKVHQATIDTVRALGSKHTLIVGANQWNSGNQLPVLGTLADTNLIYTFHSYSPFCFCNQGFDWDGNGVPDYCPTGQIFPENANAVPTLRSEFALVDDWSKTNNVPVFLGEFGASTFGDAASRCNWIEAMGDILDDFKIPSCYWDPKHWTNSYGFYIDEKVEPGKAIPCFADALHLSCSVVLTDEPLSEKSEMRLESIFPNPVSGVFTVRVETTETRKVEAVIFDVAGRKMHSTEAFLEKGTNELRLDASHFPAGVFVLLLSDLSQKTPPVQKLFLAP